MSQLKDHIDGMLAGPAANDSLIWDERFCRCAGLTQCEHCREAARRLREAPRRLREPPPVVTGQGDYARGFTPEPVGQGLFRGLLWAVALTVGVGGPLAWLAWRLIATRGGLKCWGDDWSNPCWRFLNAP